jgi:hypothetical protein
MDFTDASASGSLDDTYGVLALFNQGKARHPGSTLPVQIELFGAGGRDVSSGGISVTALGIAATTDTTDAVGGTDPADVGPLTPAQAAGGSNPGGRISGAERRSSVLCRRLRPRWRGSRRPF